MANNWDETPNGQTTQNAWDYMLHIMQHDLPSFDDQLKALQVRQI